jgi:hypothetical protein
MDQFREPEFLYVRIVDKGQPCYAKQRSIDAASISSRRVFRWILVAATTVVAAGLAWVIGNEASRSTFSDDVENSTRSPPLTSGFFSASRTEENNNAITRMGLAGDLDGTAIAYTLEADGLVSNGKFRLDLPLEQVARILGVSRQSISSPRHPDRIDPDAELFRAQVGTLTENAKGLSRKIRSRQLLEGRNPDAVVDEWVITNFSFTLNRLTNPEAEEKIVLLAIVRAASEIMPRSGEKIRAVGMSGGYLKPGMNALSPGMLPLEARTHELD